jgi:hypothetical protein
MEKKMKNKLSLAPKLALALMVLVSLACGASAQGTATDVPAATEAPPPLPDMTAARIFLDDLPAGFEEMPIDDILTEQAASGDEEYLPETLFAFSNGDEFQLIIGMNYLLVDAISRLGFGSALEDSDTLKDFAGALGGENIRDERTLNNLEAVGDNQTALTMLADVQGIPMHIDAAMFQRGVVGGLILSMRMEGEAANISIEELAEVFDQHIQESLQTD